MMLKEIQVSNFKAFAGPETVPIKPITLIFGPNSSGKSSLLQCLLMLKQTLDDRENALTPLLFRGDLVDLGSYRELIYRHEIDRSLSIKITLPMPKSLDSPFQYPWIVGAWGQEGLSELEETLTGFQTVAIKIKFAHESERPGVRVSQIDLFVGDDPLPVISYERDSSSSGDSSAANRLIVRNLNLKHPYWSGYWKTFDQADDSYIRSVLNDHFEDPTAKALAAFESMTSEQQTEFLNELEALRKSTAEAKDPIARPFSQGDSEARRGKKDRILALQGLELALEAYKIWYQNDELGLCRFLPERLNGSEMDDIITSAKDEEAFSRSLSVLTLTAGLLVRRALEQVLYIGPLRSYPERYFMFSGVSTDFVGKSGKFVPDILVGNNELLARVNEELERFNVGYELKLSSLSDPSSDIHDLFALRLYERGTGLHVSSTDVGFGFSQVLPVIVQCLISKQNMILMEQPELHLHPRLQTELGDLFIRSALGEAKNTLVIETHSEHLILRLLRRVRETAEGTLHEGQVPITPDDLAVIYAKPEEGGTKLVHLRVNEDGDFVDQWPDGFFPERARELL